MKWFKHETDAHMNLKLQAVIEKFGVAAYGYYWACVELVANQGENYRLKSEKEWQLHLKRFSGVELKTQKEYLAFFAGKRLVDGKALLKGDLFIPKLAERCDEYTEKRRRESRHHRDKVGLEKNRTEEEQKRIEETFELFWKAYPNKEAKKKSLEIWKRKKCGDHIDEILAFIEKAKGTDRWKRGFIKQPPTFLNNESWNDDLAAYNERGSHPSNALDQGTDYRNEVVEKLKGRTVKA